MDTLSCVGNPSEITWTPRERKMSGEGGGGGDMVIANLVQVLGGELELTVMVSSSTFWFRSSVFQSHTLVYEEGAFRLSGYGQG